MHTLIVGAGSVGSMYQIMLQSKKNGFSIESLRYGKHKFIPDGVYSSCKDASTGQEYDYIMVCTKALPNIADPAEILKPVIKSNKTVIVLVQNGIGIEDPYVKTYPENPIITCAVYVDGKQKPNGLVEHGKLMELAYGLHKNKKGDNSDPFKNGVISNFHNILTSGGITSIVPTNIQKLKWFKNVWNAAISPMSVISGKHSGGDLARNPGTRSLLIKAMKEMIKVGETATGGPLHDKLSASEIPDYFINYTLSLPEPFILSMLQDYLNKKPMEHHVILKNPIDEAKKLGIDVPIIETMYELLIMAEKKNLSSIDKH
ncbi:hypothetical protein BB559_002087 [Furculomyces boomerangus]|uniref:2-dehydropantoate 2-reductase n=1 Tax=Furculomyces boomerangus TaxID=61424 RepID=A0A2T9YYC7_9FUNG|nr:hypothetical protein BB559_002087 [Furculomyces boomerangus]